MAIALAPGDHVEFIVVCTQGVQTSETVFHASVTQIIAGTPTDLSAAVGFDFIFAPLFKNLMNSALAVYRGSSARILNINATNAYQFQNGGFGSGAVAGNPLPSQTRGLVSWKTDNAGRSYRGRNYIPFPSAGDNTATGVPSAGYKVGLAAIASQWGSGQFNFGDGVNTARWLPEIFHRNAPKPPAVLPLKFSGTAITAAVVGDFWATQRKSGGYGRANIPPF